MTETRSAHVFRVDTFDVPSDAREEFLENVRRTHDSLAERRGFVRDIVLEQSSGPGRFTLVTLVEWESQEAIEDAREAVHATHERRGFDPQELFSRLGIEANVATYTRVDE